MQVEVIAYIMACLEIVKSLDLDYTIHQDEDEEEVWINVDEHNLLVLLDEGIISEKEKYDIIDNNVSIILLYKK